MSGRMSCGVVRLLLLSLLVPGAYGFVLTVCVQESERCRARCVYVCLSGVLVCIGVCACVC